MLWNDWYLNANPGPYYPCLPPASGEAANPTWSFDPTVAAGSASDAVKLTYKNNNAGLVNLTPGTSYTCKTWAGELSWNATTHVLTVRGTMFIDGSAKIDNGLTNSYTGQGVIYMSGTLLIKNSKLCGQLSGSNCTTSGWNPNNTLITFVTNGTDRAERRTARSRRGSGRSSSARTPSPRSTRRTTSRSGPPRSSMGPSTAERSSSARRRTPHSHRSRSSLPGCRATRPSSRSPAIRRCSAAKAPRPAADTAGVNAVAAAFVLPLPLGVNFRSFIPPHLMVLVVS